MGFAPRTPTGVTIQVAFHLALVGFFAFVAGWFRESDSHTVADSAWLYLACAVLYAVMATAMVHAAAARMLGKAPA